MQDRGWKRTREDLLNHLQNQLLFLRSSASSFDNGVMAEAPRLANSVHLLVHDGGKSHSIMQQLGLRKKMSFVSTGRVAKNTRNLLSDVPLIRMEFSSERVCVLPLLDRGFDQHDCKSFHEWWETEWIYRNPPDATLSRRQLVFALRSQDGGSHLDTHLTNDVYVEFSRRSPWIFRSKDGEETSPMPAAFATMRQIAWELDKAFAAISPIL